MLVGLVNQSSTTSTAEKVEDEVDALLAQAEYIMSNPDEFLVETGSLQPQGGTETVEFTVDKAGIFQFACGLKYKDEETGELTGDCAPDHEQMVGYFIVLDR